MSGLQPRAWPLQRLYTQPYPGCGISSQSSLELEASPNPFGLLVNPFNSLRNWLIFFSGIGIPFIFTLLWIWSVEYGRWQIYQEAANLNYGGWHKDGSFYWRKPYVIDPRWRELSRPLPYRQIPVGDTHEAE